LQRLLIIYSQEGNLKEIADGIKLGAEKDGYRVDLVSTGDTARKISFHPYDLVVVGSPTKGIFRGKIDEDLREFLGDCRRTMGTTAAAFVTPRFFATTKALRQVMGVLEKQGCVVNNFAALKNRQESIKFGGNLQ